MQVTQLITLVAALASSATAFPGHHFEVENHVDYYAHPKYNYDYAVHDLHTGDVKNKWETRDGDVVKGSYSHNQPDGTILTVEYTADKHNGYNAVVKKHGKSIHPEQVHHDHHIGGAIAFGGHDGGHFGGFHGHANSFANSNNIAIAHHQHGGHHF